MRRGNNFDAVRLWLAFTVCAYHTYLLVRAKTPLFDWLKLAPQTLAVNGFFVVSGYLVWQSFDRSSSLGDFAMKRFRRVYPPFAVVVIVFTILSAAASGRLAVLWTTEAARFFATHLTALNFLYPNLTGVNAWNPHAQINGSLWSIKVEIGCYLLLPLLAWAGRRIGWMPMAIAVYAGSVLWQEIDLWHVAHQTPGKLGYFISGATAYKYRDWLAARWAWLVPVALALFAVSVTVRSLHAALQPAPLAVLLAWAAVGAPYLGNVGRFGDFSYGIYLVHWPILQIFVKLGWFHRPDLGVALAWTVVVAGAALCWHFVEKPFLRRDSHYVGAARAAQGA